LLGFAAIYFILKFSPRFSISTRLLYGFALCFAITISLPLTAQLFNDKSYGYSLVFILVVILGVVYTMLKASLFGMGGVLPSIYLKAIAAGLGASGVLIIVFRVLVLVIIPVGSDDSFNSSHLIVGTYIYFAVSAIVILLCIFGIQWFIKLPIARDLKEIETNRRDSLILDVSMIQEKDVNNIHSKVPLINSPDKNVEMNAEWINKSRNSVNTNTSLDLKQIVPDSEYQIMGKTGIQNIYSLCGYMMLNCMITYIVVPGLALRTQLNITHSLSWTAVIFTGLFHVFDTAGRLLVQKFAIFSDKFALITALIRIPFVFTFIAVSKGWPPNWLFGSDLFKMINMILFATTFGYSCSILIVYTPMLVKREEKEKAGILMSFGILFGCFIGVLIAELFIKHIV